MEQLWPWGRCVLLLHIRPPARDTYHQRVTDRGTAPVLIADVLKLRFFRIVITSASVGTEAILQLITLNCVVWKLELELLFPWSRRRWTLMRRLTRLVVAAHTAPGYMCLFIHFFTFLLILLLIQKIISWNVQEVEATTPALLSWRCSTCQSRGFFGSFHGIKSMAEIIHSYITWICLK